MGRWLPVVLIVVGGCSARELEQAAQNSKAELATQASEIERLKAEVARLAAENSRLLETEEGLWARAVEASEGDDYSGAVGAYSQFRRRFPTSSKLPQLTDALNKLDERECERLLSVASGMLESTDRADPEKALAGLDGKSTNEKCRSKTSRERVVVVRGALKARLEKWPAVMSVDEYTARNIELRGKRGVIAGTLTVGDYFNYNYANRARLRSFKLADDSLRSLSVYCERGPECDELLKRTLREKNVQGDWIVENAVRYFDSEGSGMGLLVLGTQQ